MSGFINCNEITNANVKAGYGYINNGVEEKNLYFYHPDHLGSSSYITDREGQVIQHTEYMAFGEIFVDEHSTTNKMPYLFNGKELDFETGLYYYGARYYDAKTSLWLNTDPLSGYNPILETEHYIDGQHNGGVFNFGNLNTYTYTYQNPILYVDPNGKQGIPGMLLGAVTEYGSIIGEKMLFENKSFSQANSELTLGDGINIGIAGATGAVSGMAKFAKWAGSSTGRKILVKMLEVGIDVVEDIVKQNVKNIMDNEEVDLKQTVVSTLTNLGMGKLLKGTSLEKHIAKQEGIVEKAQKEISDIKNSNVGTKGGQAKKIRTQNAIINNAQKEIKTYNDVNKAVNETATAGASTITTGIYKQIKEQ